jgi:hypothetical protein
MMPRRLLATLAAGVAAVAALSCGDVPTLPAGIAYISAIVPPATAVVAGDSLRDTLGNVAPLRVYSFGRDGDTLGRLATRYLVTSIDPGIRIDDATGILVASDSLRSVRIVGQVNDALQTPELTLLVVRQPDALKANRPTIDTLKPDPTAQDLRTDLLGVTASATVAGAAAAVQGVIVHYAISRIVPAGATSALPDSVIALVDEGNKLLIPTGGRTATDTTDASGLAQRRLRITFREFPTLPHVDTVEVTVTARNFRGVPLGGSPLVFVIVNP